MPDSGFAGRESAFAQVASRVALSLAVMSLLNYLNPLAHSWKPVLALSFFLILVIRRQQAHAPLSPLPHLSMRALAFFVALNVILIMFFLRFGTELAFAAERSSASALLLAFSKLLTVVPVAALFAAPAVTLRPLAPEAITAIIALLTFDPGRFFVLIWPAYSHVVASTIMILSRPFLPGVHLVPGLTHVLVVGPTRDMLLDMSCSGIKGIVLFQVLFAMMLLLEWNHINKARALFFYGAGCALLLAANMVRLAIVFLSSNLTSGTVNPSWPLFILTLLLLTWFTYDWMMPPQQELRGAPTGELAVR